jgi:hypothetical protein
MSDATDKAGDRALFIPLFRLWHFLFCPGHSNLGFKDATLTLTQIIL